MIGNYDGCLLLIQCKNVSKNISVKDIREFESSAGIYQKKTAFCVFVSNKSSPLHNNNKEFSSDAIVWVKNSKLDILLTNIFHLQNDILSHEFKYSAEDEENEELRKDISTLNNKVEKINKKLNKKVEEDDNKYKNVIFYIKIVILLLIILIILIILNLLT